MQIANQKKLDTETLKSAEEKTVSAAKEVVERTVAAAKKTASVTGELAEKTSKVAKKTVKKAVAAAKEKASEPKTTVVVEYQGRQISLENVLTAVKHDWGASGQKSAALKSLELYVKPEDSAAYYVANGKVHGKIDL